MSQIDSPGSLIDAYDGEIAKTEEEIITDKQIDDLLEEVEQIRQSSPVKIKETKTVHDEPTLQELSNEPLESLKKESTIPKSVSQALFGGALKVTKVRDQKELKFIGIKKENPESNNKIKTLQLKLAETNKKIIKLDKEINYLNNLIDSAAISSDLTEVRKLKVAIQRLQEFLDQKQKEKYEIGMVLTRAMRRRIDSGESGEFWVN